MKPPIQYFIKKDGTAWCAHGSDFVNLQESLATFGDTPEIALRNLIHEEGSMEAIRCNGMRDWKCNNCGKHFQRGLVKSNDSPACPTCKAGGQFVFEQNPSGPNFKAK